MFFPHHLNLNLEVFESDFDSLEKKSLQRFDRETKLSPHFVLFICELLKAFKGIMDF